MQLAAHNVREKDNSFLTDGRPTRCCSSARVSVYRPEVRIGFASSEILSMQRNRSQINSSTQFFKLSATPRVPIN